MRKLKRIASAQGATITSINPEGIFEAIHIGQDGNSGVVQDRDEFGRGRNNGTRERSIELTCAQSESTMRLRKELEELGLKKRQVEREGGDTAPATTEEGVAAERSQGLRRSQTGLAVAEEGSDWGSGGEREERGKSWNCEGGWEAMVACLPARLLASITRITILQLLFRRD